MPKTVAKLATKPNRDLSLDFIRGIAVLLMIITHANGIFYRGDSHLLNGFTWWGATVCFTMFLFVSASVTGIKYEKGKLDRRKAGFRLAKFLLIYYLVSFLLVLFRFGPESALMEIPNILTFSTVPEFIEFLLAFILYGLFVLLVPESLRKTLTQAYFLIPITLIVMTLSTVIYQIDTASQLLINIKFMLTGHEELHAFGIMSYFPVFALGLWWGGNKVRSKGKDQDMARIMFILSFAFWILLILTGFIEGKRWPPTITFLLYGVWFSFLLIMFSDFLIKLRYFGKSVIFVGINAFDYYILHILILFFVAYMSGWVDFNAFITMFITFFTIAISTIIIYIKKAYQIGVSKTHAH